MKRWAVWVLAAIILLGAAARLYKLDEKSLWSDEIATIATSLGNSIDPEAYALRGESFDPPAPVPAESYLQKATQSHGAGNFAQTVQVLKDNVHPPLFFWLMNLWIHAFGLSPASLRLPAVLFGILSIGLMYAVALQLTQLSPVQFSENHRQGFALLSAALMAFSGYQVDHAQDARQYTLLICLALSAICLAVALIRKRGEQAVCWVLLALVLAAGLYTQYFFGLFAGFVALVLLFAAWKKQLPWGWALGCGLLTVLLLLPWVPVFREQLGFLKLAGHYTAGLWSPIQLPEKLWRIVCEFFLPDSKAGKVMPLLVLLIWNALRYKSAKRTPESTSLTPVSPVLLLIAGWLACLIGGQILLDVLKQAHTATIRRYLLLASPACYLLMAYALGDIAQSLKRQSERWLPLALTGVLLVWMAADTLNGLLKTHTSSDEFKLAAQSVNRQSGPDDLVLVSKTGAMAVGMAYYLKPETRMWGIDVPNFSALAVGSPKQRAVLAHLPKSSHAQVWLVFSHAAPSTRKRLSDWLTGAGYRLQGMCKVPGVQVTRWRR